MEGAGHVGGDGCSRTRSRVLHSGGRPFRTGCDTSTVGQEEEAEWRVDVPCPRTRHRVPHSGGRLFRTGRDTSTAEQEVEWRLGGWCEMEAGLEDGVVEVGEGREGEGNLPSGSDERGEVEVLWASRVEGGKGVDGRGGVGGPTVGTGGQALGSVFWSSGVGWFLDWQGWREVLGGTGYGRAGVGEGDPRLRGVLGGGLGGGLWRRLGGVWLWWDLAGCAGVRGGGGGEHVSPCPGPLSGGRGR